MPTFSQLGRWCAAAAVLLSAFVTPAAAQDRLCDPATRDELGRDCRDILIQHIRAERVRLDVAFWFMEDSWVASEVINRHKAGVPVRVLMDTEANASVPRNADRLAEMKAAGIPMRERVASGILHWKMMLFEGQGIVEFSGANYSADAWTVSGPDYTNYTDESIYFTSSPSIVNSFRTKYDDLWVDTTAYRDYANITTPPARAYDVYPIDPELNFVPDESHAVRAVAAYQGEARKIDVIMYRITDSRYADAMIASQGRGVPVRLITEPLQYRDPIRQYHSWNIDRMYNAGIQIRDRAHAGLNHQKSVLLYEPATAIFGSSNWSSASSESQEEHNLFSKDPWVFQWLVDQFERKWNNATGAVETAPFAPLPPGQPTAPSPAYQATGVENAGVRLGWTGGYWAHRYDVYLGTDAGTLPRVATDVPRATSGIDYNSVALAEPLAPGTTYYWRVVGRTMADMSSDSPMWTFTTAGTALPPPPPPSVTLTRQPYLQQVTSTDATVVWTTREPGTASVRYSIPGASTTSATAVSTLYSAVTTGMAADYYQHVARITGLTPATTYQYDIVVSGVDLNPQVDTFTTAPPRGSGQVTFVAFGDSGTGSSAQQEVAARLDAETFDFALHGGDLAYGTTTGTGGATHQTMNDWFFEMYRRWLRSRPMFPSMGNHDSRAANGDGQPYRDVFVLPEQGGTGGFPDHAERYYSFDYGPVHVVVLDTELAFQGPDLARRDAQLAWADADLAATTQPWKIAVFHRSPYSAGGEHGSDLEVRAAFTPLFDRHGVQLVISAHEHDYERTVAMRAGSASADGTVYIVSGGGGGPLYPAGTGSWTAFSASQHHYLKGAATECTLRVDAITPDGAMLDGVSLERCTPPPDTQPPAAAITAPATGATVSGTVAVAVAASDNVGVSAVTLVVDGADEATDATAPFSFNWSSAAVTDGSHALRVRAVDAAGNTTLSATVTVTVANPAAGTGDIVLYAADAATVVGNWLRQNDSTAAGGQSMRNPDRGAAKRAAALATPADYFELTFTAQVNVPYRFWMRGKADGDVYSNDSVFVQFAGAGDFAIGTTNAAEYNLEDCSGCRIAGWGWQDNAWGVGVPSTPITFTTTGPHRIRIQPREDGLAIDQIILSPDTFFSTSPGALKNDTSIYPRSDGGTPTEPPVNTAPAVALTQPSGGAAFTAPATIALAASASDSDGTIVRVDFYSGATLVSSDTTSPFEGSWSGVSAGTYALTARATDDDGAMTTSSAVSITVTEPAPPPAGLPAPWTSQDIGAVGAAGSASASNGVFTVAGAGADIWSTADAFHYVWQPLRGDGDVIARVVSIENVNAWVKAGVMIRERLTPESPHALMLVSPKKGLAFQRRVASGGISTGTSGGSGTAPAWVKLERRGNTITAFRSVDGVAWTLIGSDTFTMAADVHVGLAVSSHVTGVRAAATFDNVTVTEPAPPPAGLPAPWTSQDIGAVGAAGSASASNGVFTVAGAGADIWNTADAFQYVWQPLRGDGDVIARVASIEYVHAWVKAGVMIRERLTPDSPHALMLVSPGKGLAFQRRMASGGISTSTSGGSGTAPAWVKLERRGTTITAFRSADGVAWTLIGSDTFTMAADVYVGLAVSSHVTGVRATAAFDNVTVR